MALDIWTSIRILGDVTTWALIDLSMDPDAAFGLRQRLLWIAVESQPPRKDKK